MDKNHEIVPASRGINSGVSKKDTLLLYDVLTAETLDKMNIEVIVHLAGKAHDLKKTASEQEYFTVNTDLSIRLFDAFLQSNAKVFIYMSSVKAVADKVTGTLNETASCQPLTAYGKSKLAAEQYMLQQSLTPGKRLYILRPCMIHGPGNKGNLNLLYRFVSNGIPYPLRLFSNKRSFLSIENLCFVINEIIEKPSMEPGIYHVADSMALSTAQVVDLVGEVLHKKVRYIDMPVRLVKFLARMSNYLHLPFNSEHLEKLTESYVVDNTRLISALNKELPIDAEKGLKKTIVSFAHVD